MAVGDVSFDILFPRVTAVVHHGGAGTTAAVARAGVPQIITPIFGDQFYWASRIVDLGIGAMTDAHWKNFFDKMVRAGVVKAGIDYKRGYTLQFVNKGVGTDLRPKN